jgi:hypothetical protein
MVPNSDFVSPWLELGSTAKYYLNLMLLLLWMLLLTMTVAGVVVEVVVLVEVVAAEVEHGVVAAVVMWHC